MRRRAVAGLVLAAALAGLAGQVFESASPAAVAGQEIGRSVQGRPITAFQIGDPAGQRVVLAVGMIHGDERAGLQIVGAIRRQVPDPNALAGTQLWVVPTVNPDGMRTHTRKNADAVDLNRNFPFRWSGGGPKSNGYYPGPAPASEPETRAVMAFARQIQPDLSIWYHQPWGAVLACHGRPQLAAEYAKLVGMETSCRGKGLHGTAISWESNTFPGSTAFVVEIRAGKIKGGTAERHARAALTLAKGD